MNETHTLNKNLLALKNALNNDVLYMTKSNARKFISYTKWPNKNQISKESAQPKLEIIKKIGTDNSLEQILGEYEFWKPYKYCTAFKAKDIDLNDFIAKFKKSSIINHSYYEYLNNSWLRPTIKEYEDSLDIKFSRYTGLGDYISKYPVVISIFKDSNVIIFKYSAITNLTEQEDIEYYQRLNASALNWLKKNISENINPAPLITAAKKILTIVRQNKQDNTITGVEPFALSSSDLTGGKTSLRITDNDDLPLIDSILELSKDFKDEHDKKILYDHLQSFIKESSYERIALTWAAIFNDSRGKESKTVASIEKKPYIIKGSIDHFQQIHFHAKPHLNRDRINHVIKGISPYL